MTRVAFLPLLLAACIEDPGEYETNCQFDTHADDEVSGDLAVQPAEGTPILAKSITLEPGDGMHVVFGAARIDLRRPAEKGVHDLADLGARLCFFRWAD